MTKTSHRRDFVADAGKLGLGAALVPGLPMIVPRHVLGGAGSTAPSDTVNFAVVGCGGQGCGNAQSRRRPRSSSRSATSTWRSRSATSTRSSDRPESRWRAGRRARRRALNEQFDKATKYADFREMLAKQNEHRRRHRRDARPHARRRRQGGDASRQARLRAEAADVVGARSARCCARRALKNTKLVTQMGNQGHSSDGARRSTNGSRAGVIGPVHEVHVWTESSSALLGAGPSAARRHRRACRFPDAQWIRQRRGAEHVNGTLAAAHGRRDPRPAGTALGPLSRTGRRGHSVSPDLSPVQLARLGRLRRRRARRHGRASHRSSVLGARPHAADEHRSDVVAVGHDDDSGADPDAPAGHAGVAQSQQARVVSDGVDGALPVPGARHAAAGEAELVRRRPLPPRPDGCPTTSCSTREGGGIFIGEKGILIHDTYGDNPRLFPSRCCTEGAGRAARRCRASPGATR